MSGNALLEAMCFDGVTRIYHIRGSLKQKVSVDIYFTLISQTFNIRKDKYLSKEVLKLDCLCLNL